MFKLWNQVEKTYYFSIEEKMNMSQDQATWAIRHDG